MCCCDKDVIALLCVGIPAIAYAIIVGFPRRDPATIGAGLFCTKKMGYSNCPKLTDSESGIFFIFMAVIVAISIIYGVVIVILRCLLCFCNICYKHECFLQNAYRIGVGVGLPALIDFLTYLISARVAWSRVSQLNTAIGGYSGLSMVSLACGWVFTIIIGSFFIQKDSIWLKFLGFILGGLVAFLIITIIVPCNPRSLSLTSDTEWVGLILGLINVSVFTAMYAATLCCLDGRCCK